MTTIRRVQVSLLEDSENQLPVEGGKGLMINNGKNLPQQQERRNALGLIKHEDNVQRIQESKDQLDKKFMVGENYEKKKLALPSQKANQSQEVSKREGKRKGADTGLGFSILCDESFEEDEDDRFSDASLRLDIESETSSQVKRRAREAPGTHDSLNDSTTELLAVVGFHDKSQTDNQMVLKDITHDVSMPIVTDDEDDYGLVTPYADQSMDKSGSPSMISTQEDLMGNLDSLHCSHEYRADILNYLIKLEQSYQADPEYMTRQKDINFKMRSILIDWMVEVTEEYKLQDESLFLAVSFIDRFLSLETIARQTFQLLGSASLFISSKYEEIYPPDVHEFVSITDDSYTKGEILYMEMLILKTLDMNLSSPTSHYFLKMFLTSINSSSQVSCLADYLCYLTMLEGEVYLKYSPSEIGISVLFLSTHAYSEEETLQVGDFLSQTLNVMFSQTSEIAVKDRLNECITQLANSYVHAKQHPQQAIYTRFSSTKYFSVACIGLIDAMKDQLPRLE